MKHKGLIIIDGPDATGKTTLANKICQISPGSEYIHLTYDDDLDMYSYQLGILHDAIEASKTRLVVIDRLWMSENIYAAVYRDGSDPTFNEQITDIKAQQASALYIIAMPKTVKAGVARHKEMRETRDEMYDNMEAVCKRYIDLWYGNKSCKGDSLAARITRGGGFQNRVDGLRYCIEDHGGQVEQFAMDARNIQGALRWLQQ